MLKYRIISLNIFQSCVNDASAVPPSKYVEASVNETKRVIATLKLNLQ